MKKKQNYVMPDNVIKSVLNLIKSYDSYRIAGTALGFSSTYIFQVANEKQLPSPKLAEMAGWEKVVTWRRKPTKEKEDA